LTRSQELQAKADHFAIRASRAHGRTARNTYLSLERSYRGLASQQERFEIAGRELAATPTEDHCRRA